MLAQHALDSTSWTDTVFLWVKFEENLIEIGQYDTVSLPLWKAPSVVHLPTNSPHWNGTIVNVRKQNQKFVDFISNTEVQVLSQVVLPQLSQHDMVDSNVNDTKLMD